MRSRPSSQQSQTTTLVRGSRAMTSPHAPFFMRLWSRQAGLIVTDQGKCGGQFGAAELARETLGGSFCWRGQCYRMRLDNAVAVRASA